jgi:cytochrome c biogenesis factor
MVNPMIGWIWAATGIMALGGVLGLALPRREGAAAVVREATPSPRDGLHPAAGGSR